jgi:tRNA(Ile)-lysidine synthase
MASSRRSSRRDAGDVATAIATSLDGLGEPRGPYAVALSGGRDSVALLDAVVDATRERRRAVVALHVHHGLSPNADAWSAHCAALCATYAIPFVERRVTVPRASRASIEASARAVRYDALAAAAADASAAAVLLAHHRDDQAETLLLQLLRGAGPHGLAAMPKARVDARGIVWVRPLIDTPRAAVEAYVAARGLRYVDDESNADARYVRNALRHRVAPSLAALAPGYSATLARAAELQADAARLADDLASADACGAIDENGALDRAVLAALPDHRARNLLRWYLRQHGLPPPSHARVAAMLAQLAHARADSRVRLAHAGVEIGVHRERVVIHTTAPPAYERSWDGESVLALPHGRLAFAATDDGGLDRSRLCTAPLLVRSRRGGERLTLDAGRPRRALKDMLRECGLAPWDRAALPLLFCGDALAAVPGLGVDVAFRAEPGREGVALVWSPNDLRRARATPQVADRGPFG